MEEVKVQLAVDQILESRKTEAERHWKESEERRKEFERKTIVKKEEKAKDDSGKKMVATFWSLSLIFGLLLVSLLWVMYAFGSAQGSRHIVRMLQPEDYIIHE